MMDDYGTELCCDEVNALRNIIESLHDIHQERIEKYEAKIARLEDIIAQMSDELTDAYMARDEANKECAALEIEKNRWGEMYWELKNSPKLWNPFDLPERTFLRSYPCAYQYRDEEE